MFVLQGAGDVKVRAAERPHSLNIVSNTSSSEGVLPIIHSSSSGSTPSQQPQGTSTVRLQTDKASGDILEQSLRAANVLSDYSKTASMSRQPRSGASLSLTCTPTSSVSACVTHSLGSTADSVLDYSPQQRLQQRRQIGSNNNDSSSSSGVMYGCVRQSLTDIMTPTSDVTTASSPSDCFSQVSAATFSHITFNADYSRHIAGANSPSEILNPSPEICQRDKFGQLILMRIIAIVVTRFRF